MAHSRRLALPDMPHPARCPGCGAGVKLTLVSDPGTPVYLCGSTPFRIVCIGPAFAASTSERRAELLGRYAPNVAVLDSEDRHELRTLFLGMSRTINVPHLSVCTFGDCELVAIDGRCLAGHDLDDLEE